MQVRLAVFFYQCYNNSIMGGVILKTIFFLLLCFAAYAGWQYSNKAGQPIQQATEAVSGKLQLEQKKRAEKSLATIKCQELCQAELVTDETTFITGPCLSEAIIPDWACDIAHSPRQAVDDDPANQCASFRLGQTQHFVEVDGNCNTLKVY